MKYSYKVKYWVQDTAESGHWAETDKTSYKAAKAFLKTGNFERAEIVECL